MPVTVSMLIYQATWLMNVMWAGSQVCRNMGCMFSTEAVEDFGGPPVENIPIQSGEIHVFVPGLREPKQIDLTELLKGSVSAGLAARLHSLRSQVISASSGKGPVVKLSRRKSLDGKDDVSVAKFCTLASSLSKFILS